MLRSSKHLRNFHESTFKIFFYLSQGNWFGKCSTWRYVKSYGCLITHWLPMRSILFEIVRICRSQFECSCLKNENLFLIFSMHIWNLHQFLDILKKKMIVASNLLLEFKSGTDVVRQISKKPRFRTSFNSQDVKGLQKSVKSAWKHFYHIFSSHWGKLIWKMSLLVIFAMLGVFVTT